MESFTGVVVRRIDQHHYSVKRTDLGPGYRGQKHHYSKLTRHTVEAETPAGISRIRWSQLDERTRERLLEAARQEVSSGMMRLGEENRKLLQANRLAEDCWEKKGWLRDYLSQF